MVWGGRGGASPKLGPALGRVVIIGDTDALLVLLQEGRETTPDIATSPRRQPNAAAPPGQPAHPGQPGHPGPHQGLRPKDPPPMVIQGDFRKVSIVSIRHC